MIPLGDQSPRRTACWSRFGWLNHSLEKFWASPMEVVREGDLVRCYVLCQACRRRTRSYEYVAPEDEIAFIV